MKTRESGMPDKPTWEGFFNPQTTLRKLGLSSDAGEVVDFGCGYGTFAIPAARITTAVVHALDIDPAMVDVTRAWAEREALPNVRASVRDFVVQGTGLADASVGFAMLFNILHCEQPDGLLREAHRILRPGGTLAIMHWRRDMATPRGPSMDIRPRPEQCRQWAEHAGFERAGEGFVDLPPYHWGLAMAKP